MSTWTTPITWSVGQTVTKAQADTEIRDHFNHLYGGLTLITDGTFLDTGVGMLIRLYRASGNPIYATRVTADTQDRLQIKSGGGLSWGSGSAAQDVALSRVNAGSALQVTNDAGGAAALDVFGTITSGKVGADLIVLDANGFMELHERTDPAAPAANNARLYIRDNGSGKTQFCVRYATGVVQVLNTQP